MLTRTMLKNTKMGDVLFSRLLDHLQLGSGFAIFYYYIGDKWVFN